jgi:hypothetical protein
VRSLGADTVLVITHSVRDEVKECRRGARSSEERRKCVLFWFFAPAAS